MCNYTCGARSGHESILLLNIETRLVWCQECDEMAHIHKFLTKSDIYYLKYFTKIQEWHFYETSSFQAFCKLYTFFLYILYILSVASRYIIIYMEFNTIYRTWYFERSSVAIKLTRTEYYYMYFLKPNIRGKCSRFYLIVK